MRLRESDPVIFFGAVALSAFGVVMVYSASHILALDRYGDPLFFVKRHLTWTLVGFGMMLLLSRVETERWRAWAFPVLLLSLAGLALVFVPGLGRSAGGARRWLALGPFSFQPGEAAKLGIIVFLAHFLTVKEARITDLKYGFLPPVMLIGLILGLILVQPDLGTALLIAVLAAMLLYLAGARWSHLAASALVCAPVILWMIFATPWRFRRILAFLDPFASARDTGYQLVQSLLALGRGGVYGLGLGEGRQKLLYLPEPHTDFIYAVVGEELGLIGALAVAALFVLLLYRGMRVAARCTDRFRALLAAGVTLLVSLQGLLNMAVVTGLVPTTGVPLPLISLGGTSMVVTLSALGLLLAAAQEDRPAGAPMEAAPARAGRGLAGAGRAPARGRRG